jgi:hypothetical protein
MKKLFVITALIISAATLQAEESHAFQASLTPDIAIYPKTAEINGLSLGIWGENPQHGAAIGVVNGSTGESSGFTWAVVNYSDTYTGVALGWVNVSKTSFVGWQYGLVNVAKGEFTGFQSGWIFNYAQKMKGLQLGLVNYSENLHGVQIGLANIVINNGWFNDFPDKLATGFPIANWSF